MKVLKLSNVPWAQSGYGVQTRIFSDLLNKAGHEVIIAANYGLGGAMLNAGFAKVFPVGYEPHGVDMLAAHVAAHDPDIVWILYDIWVFPDELLTAAHVTSWVPIDHEPAPPAVVAKLRHCAHVVAMSRFGERQLKVAGLNPYYVPHGVETEIYTPVADRAKMRAQLDLPEGAYVVVTLAANKGYPSRKNLDRMIKAWALFVQQHPGSIWMLHTNPKGQHGGLEIAQYMAHYGVPPSSVRLPDDYRYVVGGYSGAQINQVFNAADLFWLPSGGEGFGVPIVEAQASGCPVAVTDFTSMSELAGPGYLIPIDPIDDLIMTPQRSEQAVVPVSKMVKALEWGYDIRGNEKLRADSRAFAVDYEAQTIFGKYMLPVMNEIADRYKSVRKRRELVVIPSRISLPGLDKPKPIALPTSIAVGPDVSVLMPAYKSEKTIIPAIRSVFEQRGVKVELLVCHDEGGDNTGNILNGWHDARLKVFKGAGNGIAASLAQISSRAQGRYVIRLDSDDTYAAGCLAEMVKALDHNSEAGFVYGCVQYHGESNQKFVPGPFDPDEFWLHNASLYPIMYRREALEECQYRPLFRVNGKSYDMEDWDFVLQLISHQYLGLALPDVLVLHYNYMASGIDHERAPHTDAMLALFRARWPRIPMEVKQ